VRRRRRAGGRQRSDRGIVIGGTGAGELVACNKVRGIRAARGHGLFTTEISRAHHDGNVLVIGTMVVAPRLAERITELWLGTPFKGDQHQRRLDLIAALERGEPVRPA
jgi:ribose 5-phosphate isomerase B